MEKAECLNDCFVTISTVDDSNVQLPPFQSRCENSLSTIRCTASEIETLIKLLNTNKASGPCAVCNRMLKEVAKEVSFPLEILLIGPFANPNFHRSSKNQT